MAEYNIYPSVDENLNFPPSLRAAIAAYPELQAMFATNVSPTISNATFTGTTRGITSAMVGLGNVNNTADSNKPVSSPMQTALNLKADLANPTFTGTVKGVTAAMVGLGNVNNTADSAKPVSNAVAAAYIPKWKASTAYSANTQVIAPTNEVVSAFSAHTSGTTYDSSLWKGTIFPYGRMGKTSGFQPLTGIQAVNMDAGYDLKGGVTYEASTDSLIIPETGLYHIEAQVYITGAGTGFANAQIRRNASETGLTSRAYTIGGNDTVFHFGGKLALAKASKIALYLGTPGEQAWGTNGINGCWISVAYLGAS